MAKLSRAALEAFFETGDKPTQAQFADLIESLYNFIDDGAAAGIYGGDGTVTDAVVTILSELFFTGAGDLSGSVDGDVAFISTGGTMELTSDTSDAELTGVNANVRGSDGAQMQSSGGPVQLVPNSGVSIKDSPVLPDAFAILDIVSTTKAVIFPRMTTAQRDVITAIDGMVIYNTTLSKLQVRAAAAWVSLH